MATELNLPTSGPSYMRGDTVALTFVMKDKEAQSPIDITGRTYWLTLKLNPSDGDADAAFQTSIVAPADTDSTNGIIRITVPASSTREFVPTKYYYDLQQVQAPDIVTTIVYGKISFRADITLGA